MKKENPKEKTEKATKKLEEKAEKEIKKLQKKLEKVADNEKNKGRFKGILNVKEFNGKPSFKASIDSRRFKDIQIKYNPEFEDEHPGVSERVMKYLTRHEINHRGYHGFHGCPRTRENHVEKLFEPIHEILKRKNVKFRRNDSHYATNALEDTILQRDLAKGFDLEGQIDFWDDVGKHSGKGVFSVDTEKAKYTEFYEAHVKLNLLLWGRKKDKQRLQKYYTHSDKVKEVILNFLERTGIDKMTYTINVNGEELKVKNRDRIREYLNNENNWNSIAQIYAEEFSELMTPGYAQPLSSHSGEGTSGHEGDEDEGESQEPDDEDDMPMEPPKEGNQFDKEMYNPEYQKNRMRKAYEKDEGIPNWMNYYDALNMVYQHLARGLKMKVESYTESTKMPLFHYGNRPFDPEKDNLRHVDFGFDEKGKVELKKKRWHEDIPLEYKINPMGFPEMRFCLLDTSPSMQSNPYGGSDTGNNSVIPWGDNSKYHYALLGWYGLIEYLKENHLLKETNIMLANFADRTTLATGLEESKRLALSPQFNSWGTNIDLDQVKHLFKGREMLVFTISDGAIHNWGDIKEDFIKYAKNHHYFHLQIGEPSQATKDMEEAGLYVEYIYNGEDLAAKTIDLTDRLYRSCGRR